MKSLFWVFFCLLALPVCGQKADYSILSLPDSLKQNANAVVRLERLDVDIASQRSMTVKQRRVVTVFNEHGFSSVEAIESYDKRTTIKNIEATVFDAFGKELKRFKRKDFRDQTAADGSTFVSDGRILYLEYTPTEYPITIVYDCEISSSNTAFLPEWQPVKHYYLGIEKSVLSVTFPSDLGFKKKELHFSRFPIVRGAASATHISYEVSNIVPYKYEELSPAASDFFPRLMMGLDYFQLEGVDGNAKSWKEFGKWFSEKILSGTDEIPDETKLKIRQLVGDEKDPIKKARIVYDFVQQKSRYVSIQEGIGGWRPMLAKDVDRLGYGDCKALSNYTKALLEAVDVPAYYTRIFGSPKGMNRVDPDFVGMQFNHVILAIPDGSNYRWMECTSQSDPFDFQAGFTDDRYALVLKPDGGEMIKTKFYDDKGNSQFSKGHYGISENGLMAGQIRIVSEGAQYSKYHIAERPANEKEAHYKEYWSNIGNLKIVQSAFANDKQKVAFTETLDLQAENYGSLSGGRMMFAVNAFNQTGSVKRIRNRKFPFEMARGSYDVDEISVELPEGFAIEALPQDFKLSGKYGDYETQLVQSDERHLVYKRTLLIKKGLYPSNEYEDFRQFMDQVSRNDNAKIVLIKKP
ncbi:DUF3857 domain-containing protein [Flavobacterium caeni]|uniref:DUF3857 domain-containing protein n=1 Tax=Flavobacterium caeni TaxID=490189 RepID=A0A1G5JT84_9FLAO|nr:DUF3857 domain-containing protein [Flavobacterium caeni]SCY91546.1 protein of unknown function [Flavobacterium caeni]